MPRCARIKSENGIFHIMIKSISEVPFFKNNSDKDMYINFMKHYKKVYNFKVYAYCFMSNHAHFIIDANGADISKFMHGINFRFAINFNKKHNRNGHLFQNRFKSKVIHNNRYLIRASAYIHRNPIDIKKYKNFPEQYKYSSLPVYLGLKKDYFNLVDEDFIMQLINTNIKKARKRYINIVYNESKDLEKEIEFEDEKTHYNSERTILVRNFNPDDILHFISKKLSMPKIKLHIKNCKTSTKARALSVLLMRSLCDFNCKDICKILGNITQSRVSSLCSLGVDLIENEDNYKNIVSDFISTYSA
ncbi:transposase [Clostridium lundense]|uniref:transposase n=1 Tax=Clostridium lundense TaxID=319475 RepID=UPI00055230EA|nr:transposase [Clostridium lundense]